MSSRYGDRTRSGDSVSGRGRRASAGAPKNLYEQIFLSPGTWTWPGKVTYVEAFVVGGGGGGGIVNPSGGGGGGGGGGRVLKTTTPVSGPVPVTVGAGGTGATPAAIATVGGTSAFGPLGPGPVPLIPAPTIAAGGGGAGGGPPATPISAPPIGGGGGGYGQSDQYAVNSGFGGYGSYGVSSPTYHGGDGGGAGGSAFQIITSQPYGAGRGIDGYGGGGGGASPGMGLVTDGGGVGYSPAMPAPLIPAFLPGQANTGGGGGGSGVTANPAQPAGAGGSGIVIVRWME